MGANLPNYDWSYDNDITWPGGDREYKLESRATDDAKQWDDIGAGNQESAYNTQLFIVDDTPPLVLIPTPTALAVKAMAKIEGTASDPTAGFDYAQIRISTGAGAQYWNGTVWTAVSNTWRPAPRLGASTTYWSYTVDQPMLKDDIEYKVEARAVDYAGNVSVVYSTYTATYDTTGPTVSLTFPSDVATYSRIRISTPVQGTSGNTQTSENTGVSTVALAISEVIAVGNNYNTCFNGTTFVGCGAANWLPAQGSLPPWSFIDPELSFTNDLKYKVEARSMDTAGNASAVSSVIIYYDLDKPTSTVVSPGNSYITSWSQITGYAWDDVANNKSYEATFGTYTVKVAIQRIGAGWWNGTFGGGSPVWYETVVDTSPYAQGYTTYTWTYNMPAPLQSAITTGKTFSYLVVPWAYDLAQNREFGPNTGDPASGDIPGGVGRVILFDNEKPVAVATAPANNAYLNGPVTLYGTATDNISGISGVIDRVLVQVKARGANNSYWMGTYTNSSSDWDDGPNKYTHWSTATYAGGGWSIPLPNLTPVNNSKISVWARAVDQAGNWMDSPTRPSSTATSAPSTQRPLFHFDNTMPLTTAAFRMPPPQPFPPACSVARPSRPVPSPAALPGSRSA